MALAKFLESSPQVLPRLVSGAPAPVEGEPKTGAIRADVEDAFAIVVDEEGTPTRLSWEKSERESRDESPLRELAPGRYRVIRYGVAREEEDATWRISVTGRKILELEVKTGEETKLELSAHIRVGRHLAHGQVSMTIQDRNKAGLTIYKDGARIPVEYVVEKDGRELARGQVRYG